MNIGFNVNQLAQQFAKFAGPLAKQGFELAVRQQYVIAVQDFVTAALCVILAFALAKYTQHLWRPVRLEHGKDIANQDEFILFGGTTALIVMPVASVISFIVAVTEINDGVAHLINPGWYAIQQIACTIHAC